MQKIYDYFLKLGPQEYKVAKYHSSSTQPQPKNGGFKMGQLFLDLKNLQKTWKSSSEAYFAEGLWSNRASYEKSNAILRRHTNNRFKETLWTIHLKPNHNPQITFEGDPFNCGLLQQTAYLLWLWTNWRNLEGTKVVHKIGKYHSPKTKPQPTRQGQRWRFFQW